MENKDNYDFLASGTRKAVSSTLEEINKVVGHGGIFGLDLLPEYREAVLALSNFRYAAGKRIDALINEPKNTFIGNLSNREAERLLIILSLWDAKDYAQTGCLEGVQASYARFQRRVENDWTLTEKENKKLKSMGGIVESMIKELWLKKK